MKEELQPIREPLTPKEVKVRYTVLKKDLNFKRLQKKLLDIIWGNMPERFECKDGFHLGDYSKNVERIIKTVEDELRAYLKTYYPDLFYYEVYKYRKESLPKPPEVKNLPKRKRAFETWEEYYLRCGFDLNHLEQKLKHGKILRGTRKYTPTWEEYCEMKGKDPNDLRLKKLLTGINAIREFDVIPWKEYCEKKGLNPNDIKNVPLRKRLITLGIITENDDDDSSSTQGAAENNGAGDSNA